VLRQGEDFDPAQFEAKLKEAIDEAEELPKALLGIF
jgi:hypothetical protein